MAANQGGPLTPLSLAILMALADGELHGYGIMKTVERQSGGRIRPGAGSLYAALDRMARSGWIEERMVAGAQEAQRLFSMTALGRGLMRAELERLAAVVRAARHNKLIAEGA
jgi:DNA-binding PadR family transcriptional regulator